MKHQLYIGLFAIVLALFLSLAPWNYEVVSLRYWGGTEIKWPLWFFIATSWLVGAIFIVVFIYLGRAADALDRRFFHWEPKARRQARGFLKHGREAMERGEEHAAHKYFLKAQRLDPRYAEAHKAMAEWLNLNDKYSEAIEEVRKAASLDPLDVGALEQLAMYASEAGEPGRSADALIRLLELRPESHRAQRMLPTALADAGRWEEALEAQKKLIFSLHRDQRGPQFETLRGIKSELARAILTTQPKRALKLLRGVLKESPAFVPAAIIYADQLSRSGNIKGAHKALADAFGVNPEVELYEKLADLDGPDSFEQAEKAAIDALAEHPRHHALRLARVRRFLLRGRFTDAKEELEKISGPPDAFRQLCWAMVARNTDLNAASEAEKSALQAFKVEHSCSLCGHRNPGWAPRCPDCSAWNTLAASETR